MVLESITTSLLPASTAARSSGSAIGSRMRARIASELPSSSASAFWINSRRSSSVMRQLTVLVYSLILFSFAS